VYFLTKTKWEEQGYSNTRHIFFIQVWRELLSKRTSISWQVKTSNTKSLVNELLYNVEIVKEYPKAIDNISPIIEEINNRYDQENLIIDKVNPLFANCLRNLNKIEIKYDNIKQIYTLASLLSLGLSLYQPTLFLEIESILSSELKDSRYKRNLYTYISGLLTELISTGYSYAFLETLLEQFDGENRKPFKQSFEEMKERLNQGDLEFRCIYEFRSLPEYFDLYKSLESPSTPITINTNGISFSVIAKDIHSAVILARSKITKIEHLVSLYYETSSIDEKFSQFRIESSEYQEENDIKIAFTSKSKLNIYNTYGSRTRKIARSKEKIFLKQVQEKLQKEVSESDKEIIYSSLNSYNQSINATTDEIKFTNLWVAFEALIQSISGSTKSKIETKLPAILSANYITSIVKDIARDLRTFDTYTRSDDGTTNFLDPLYENIEKGRFNLSKVFELLRNPETYITGNENNNDEINYNPLLCFRISVLNEDFKNSKALAQKLATHINTLRLQLLRIYRMRNFILHKAAIPHEIKLLTTHLDFYYQITITTILTMLLKYPKLSIANCMEYANLQIQGLLELLNQDSACIADYTKIRESSLPIV
jgi:hypothetical protein